MYLGVNSRIMKRGIPIINPIKNDINEINSVLGIPCNIKRMSELVKEKPKLKYLFTGGKGGVGKTISAAGIAYYYASNGYKTLLASLNPVHSLTSLFKQDLMGGSIKKVEGVENLYAVEVEIDDVVARYKENVSRWIRIS